VGCFSTTSRLETWSLRSMQSSFGRRQQEGLGSGAYGAGSPSIWSPRASGWPRSAPRAASRLARL